MPFMPWFPPINMALPPESFEGIIAQNAIQLAWAKSHNCTCVQGNQEVRGTADPGCQTCFGRGYYWDPLSAPFTGLITFIHMSPTPDEPGAMMDEKQGLILNGEPALTIPHTATTIWQQASAFDLFVATESIIRLNATLQVGSRTTLPYPQMVTVAPTGAVTVYDPVNQVNVPVSSYTVSGTSVTISGYPVDTSYVVEFTSAPTYVAFRLAGAPAHVRPFGGETLPRRFRLQTLDLWLRSNGTAPIPTISASGS